MNYKEIIYIILAIAIAYVFTTNSTLILISSVLTIIIIIIVLVVAAYYILPAVGITAFAGFMSALATLIGITRKR